MSADANKNVALAFFKAFWDADMVGTISHLAPGATFLMMPTVADQRINDAATALQRIIDTMFIGFDPADGLKCEVTSIIAEGNEVAMEYTARARTRSGKRYENFYSAHLTIVGGKITVMRTYADTTYLKTLLMSPENS
jgi:ketosteroid isomerase-like protein